VAAEKPSKSSLYESSRILADNLGVKYEITKDYASRANVPPRSTLAELERAHLDEAMCRRRKTMRGPLATGGRILRQRIAGIVRIVFIAYLALAAGGCVTPIGVTRVDPRTAQFELTANALNTDRPSSFSTQQLLNLDLYQLFNDDPKEALARLHKGLAPTGDEDRVFALAELSFLYAENSEDRSYYLATTVYASAFLLPGKNGTPPRPIDPRARWAVDI
jgi:hypothetical protein